MTTPVPLARRVMKARKNGTCPLCPGGAGLITTGQQIGLIPGWGWCHTCCVIMARRADHQSMSTSASGPSTEASAAASTRAQ